MRARVRACARAYARVLQCVRTQCVMCTRLRVRAACSVRACVRTCCDPTGKRGARFCHSGTCYHTHTRAGMHTRRPSTQAHEHALIKFSSSSKTMHEPTCASLTGNCTAFFTLLSVILSRDWLLVNSLLTGLFLFVHSVNALRSS